jgi:2-aminobenzoate-CoA ligase
LPKISDEYLPPKDALPEKIYAIPEVRYPGKFNLAEAFLIPNVQKWPDKVAILYKDRRISYNELYIKVNKVGNALKSLEVQKGDRVMVRGPNIPEFIETTLACWKIGAIVVPIPPILGAESIAYRANDSEAVAMIVSSDGLEEVKKAESKLKTIKNIVAVRLEEGGPYLSYEEIVERESSELEPEDTMKDHIGRIMYTSGTTGVPKGCILTLADIRSVADTHGRYVLGLRKTDVIGGPCAITFNMGNVNFTMEPWPFGAAVSLMEDFTPEKTFEVIEKHRITILKTVPTAFRMMLEVKEAEKKYDLSSLRLCESAGESLTADTYIKWKKRFGVEILDSLGSSELQYWLSTREGLPESKIGSTGTPIQGYECKIVDENFNEVPPGTPGRLIVRGPVGIQYWRKPDKQREAIHNGWSDTELIFKEDEDGYFWYISRADDMIVSSGYKIPGGEVEKILNEHPKVLECAVVASPDYVRGNVVKAFVVLKEGYEPSDTIVKELQDYVKSKIDPYKYPRGIEFVKELPKGPTGKIARHLLREMEQKKYEEKKTH